MAPTSAEVPKSCPCTPNRPETSTTCENQTIPAASESPIFLAPKGNWFPPPLDVVWPNKEELMSSIARRITEEFHNLSSCGLQTAEEPQIRYLKTEGGGSNPVSSKRRKIDAGMHSMRAARTVLHRDGCRDTTAAGAHRKFSRILKQC